MAATTASTAARATTRSPATRATTVIRGGAGDDNLLGGAGNDRITGGPGQDQVYGGNGKDIINVRDGEVDTVHCGAGRDRVIADADDVRRPRLRGRPAWLIPRPRGPSSCWSTTTPRSGAR